MMEKLFQTPSPSSRLGWGGVCVEPSPGPFLGLLKLHGQRPDIQIVQAAIAWKDEWLTFHDSGGDAISTLSLAHRAKWEIGHQSPFTPFQLRAVTMAQLLEKFGTDFCLHQSRRRGHQPAPVQATAFRRPRPEVDLRGARLSSR